MRLNLVLGKLARATALLHSRSFRFGHVFILQLFTLFHNSVFVRLLYPLLCSLVCGVCPWFVCEKSVICVLIYFCLRFSVIKTELNFLCLTNTEEFSQILNRVSIGFRSRLPAVRSRSDFEFSPQHRASVSCCSLCLATEFKSTFLKGKQTFFERRFLRWRGAYGNPPGAFGCRSASFWACKQEIGLLLTDWVAPERLSIARNDRKPLLTLASVWPGCVCIGSAVQMCSAVPMLAYI